MDPLVRTAAVFFPRLTNALFILLRRRTWLYPTDQEVREYQFRMVRGALFANTLVCLPTGLGKTLIAAVVILNFYRCGWGGSGFMGVEMGTEWEWVRHSVAAMSWKRIGVGFWHCFLPTFMSHTQSARLPPTAPRWFPDGKLVFTAPTKPLVEQQHRACLEKTHIPKVRCGVTQTDSAMCVVQTSETLTLISRRGHPLP